MESNFLSWQSLTERNASRASERATLSRCDTRVSHGHGICGVTCNNTTVVVVAFMCCAVPQRYLLFDTSESNTV